MGYKAKWTQMGYDCPLVNKLVCSKIQQQMGGRLKVMIVGGAPLNHTTQATIKAALNLTLIQGMDFDDLSYGRVGIPLQGVKVKLVDWAEGGYHRSDEPNPRGEIVFGGDSIVMGYYKLPEQTQEAFEVDERGVRWFHSGDIGEMFADGTFKIIDRRKDLIKLQNAEYVSLGKIEALMKSCQYVDNICVCGGTYSNELTALVSPNQKNLQKLSQELGLKDTQIGDLCRNADVCKRVYAAIVQTGQSAGISKREIPVRIRLVPDEWTPDNDMLTSAMKMKRRIVEKQYHNEINGLFADNDIHSIISNTNSESKKRA
ncbi:unnamed protein product [Medioppia subpectinata]|uniref:long-chain-fatty-acid--CoA ligase n=1 Tax=Medioppia subpectinata TaxID=1979941 RepID=A0A7R9L8Y0_9ACAR|nr:unnamed protein product [Medioppia subpectinata]CAG2116583.1 unnamed protein product [Medioppia subpectinata]